MRLPSEVPVMTLPGATLFPQALLPMYIFEPRYRKMLGDMLHSNRMFSVAMRKPGRTRDIPCDIAGLGLIRVSVGHNDGTSHLILQGLVRVQLRETVQYKPYRVQAIRPIQTPAMDHVQVDALMAKVFDLVRQRMDLGGLPSPLPLFQALEEEESAETALTQVSTQDVLNYLENLSSPEAVADMVACSLLASPLYRQTILEAMDLEQRLKHLIHFLMAEIQVRRKNEES